MTDRPEAAGRPALAASLAGDYERFCDLVDALPRVLKKFGRARTVAWARTVLTSAFDTIALSEPVTPRQLQRITELRLNFTEGGLTLMMRDDRIGERRRMRFLAACEHILLGPTLRAVFRASAAARSLPEEAYRAETEADIGE